MQVDFYDYSSADSEVFGQLIYDIKDNKFMGVELLGRPKKEVECIEAYFAQLPAKDAACWTVHQMNVGESLHTVLGILATVNIDNHALPYIEFNQIKDYHLGLEFTDISGLPLPEDICRLKRTYPNLKIILDDYKMTSNLFDPASGYDPSLFDIIKLDMCIIKRLRKYPGDANGIRDIVAKLKDAGCDIIIEGVETEEDLILAKIIDVSYVQGYYFCKPEPISSVFNLLAENKQNIKQY